LADDDVVVMVVVCCSCDAQEHLNKLWPAREHLLGSQAERGLAFPCSLDATLAGVAQCWFAGFSWRELVDTTSLDQGDICRHLRRVIDALRQIPVLPKGLVPERLKNAARDAADRMDRFPVADDLLGERASAAQKAEDAEERGADDDDDVTSGGEVVAEEEEGDVEVERYDIEEYVEQPLVEGQRDDVDALMENLFGAASYKGLRDKRGAITPVFKKVRRGLCPGSLTSLHLTR
jgi:hypothetical protein